MRAHESIEFPRGSSANVLEELIEELWNSARENFERMCLCRILGVAEGALYNKRRWDDKCMIDAQRWLHLEWSYFRDIYQNVPFYFFSFPYILARMSVIHFRRIIGNITFLLDAFFTKTSLKEKLSSFDNIIEKLLLFVFIFFLQRFTNIYNRDVITFHFYIDF